MFNSLISIIVPVYKVERYLPRCIESILRQTYTNFELILVDDGTPDRSGIICDRYAEKDSRIRVIHKENGGVSSARNAGIDAAQGEWITFIDSDDWVTDNYLSVLSKPFEYSDYDLTVGLLEFRYFTILKQTKKEACIFADCTDKTEVFDIISKMEFSGPTHKLFSKMIIEQNNLRFPVKIAVAEDAIFVKRYLQKCEKIYMTGKTIYHYNRLNELSVTRAVPYFPDRTTWDKVFIDTYKNTLHVWGVEDSLIKQEISRQAFLLFLLNSRSIIGNFSRQEAENKLAKLIDFYINWITLEELKLKDEKHQLVLNGFKNKDTDAIYNLLKPQKPGVIIKLKQILKKIIRPIIEKYRDGLVKFKF